MYALYPFDGDAKWANPRTPVRGLAGVFDSDASLSLKIKIKNQKPNILKMKKEKTKLKTKMHLLFIMRRRYRFCHTPALGDIFYKRFFPCTEFNEKPTANSGSPVKTTNTSTGALHKLT